MGRYNPHLPRVMGQEWVPILEQPLTLTPRTNLVEVGHTFTLTSSKTIQTTRFYLQDWAPDNATSQVFFANVYRHGTADLSGPIRSVVIPCSLGTASPGSVALSGSATTISAALFSPSDNALVVVNDGFTPTIDLRFDTESYMPLLAGKRILGIDFLYTYTEDEGGELPLSTDLILGMTGSDTIIVEHLAPTNTSAVGTGISIGRQTVGEVDYYWNAPSFSVEVLPWTPNRLRAFDNGSGLSERNISFSVSGNPPTANQAIWFGYAALEVFFCEEQRVLYGGRTFGSGSVSYVLGVNQITMRDLSDAANPVLPAGVYDVVLSSAELSIRDDNIYPELNQIRELYPLPTHPPVRIVRPFPLHTSLGKEFRQENTLLLPQLSLHASGGAALTEVHVYGRQAVAQVYGSVTATQEIYDVPAGGAASYPWVRYYARRFGNSTVPLKLSSTTPSVSGSSVEITPTEFDELDDIVDGWKEVTLRFDTAPTMGAGTIPQWIWSAAGETAGSRWEVLGAIAPAMSGSPLNLLNTAPSTHQLSIATYGMPTSGANVNLGWVPQYAPPVSATVDDQTSDAMLIFSQDMPTVTGFSAELAEQELTGIGLDCGLNPCCIPTALDYVELSWDLPPNTDMVRDTFSRVEDNTWGTPDIGPAYEYDGVMADYSVDGTKGRIDFSFSGGSNFASLDVDAINFDATLEVTFITMPASGTLSAGILGRFTDAANFYLAAAQVSSPGLLTLKISSYTVTETILGSYIANDMLMAAGSTVNIRFMVYGSFLKAKVWEQYTEEPETWAIEVNSTANNTSGDVGIIASNVTASSAHSLEFDNFLVGPPDYYFDHYELQRMDTVTPEWQTIMSATDPATSGFNDYEARVGILSSYRIRAVDIYDFPGPWSATVTATVPEPGVTIGCTGGHLLIFTSNEEQDGSINLAYSSVWEDRVEEGFVFPEARFVELQAMYNRDYFTAFRPTERGGEQFSRTVLVQAAAIDPETLADFTSLRDMAWANVSYICVRDEDGNRWFATVLVPGGRVVHSRRLYTAPVEIIEVTDTPSEVDP